MNDKLIRAKYRTLVWTLLSFFAMFFYGTWSIGMSNKLFDVLLYVSGFVALAWLCLTILNRAHKKVLALVSAIAIDQCVRLHMMKEIPPAEGNDTDAVRQS